MKVICRAIIAAGAVLLVLLAVSNRQTVTLALWPLPFLADIPLYVLFFASLLVGALIGGTAVWAAGRHVRGELRRRRRRIDALGRELALTQSRLGECAQPPSRAASRGPD